MSETKKIEFAKEVETSFGKDFFAKFKKLHTKFFGETPAPAPTPDPAPVALKEWKTKDGTTTISVQGETIDVNVPVMDASTGMALADGSYPLEDGTEIKVLGGIVTAIEKPTPAPTPADMATVTATFKAEFKKQEVSFAAELKKRDTELSELKADLKDMFEINAEIATKFAKAEATPVATPVKKVLFEKELSEEEYNKLSNADKVRYKQGKL